MKVYLDSDYICHTVNSAGYTEYETDEFDGKCRAYIEGMRLVPKGASWTRADGEIFHGLMVSPAVDAAGLYRAQETYEEDMALSADAISALEVLGVTES